MAYQLDITSRASRCIAEIVEYLCYEVGGTGNYSAARKFLSEYETVLGILADRAESYAYCSEDELRRYGYRRVRFKTLKYKVFYRVDGERVTIDLITHDLQDYTRMI